MTFRRVLRFSCIIAILFFVTIVPTSAVTTSLWEQQLQKDFEEDSPKNVSITSQGEVMLAPKLESSFADTQEIYIWCLAEDSHGNIYAGTGNGGKLYRITPDGQSSLFYDSPEVSILSLAVDASDNLYAGTAPDGLIYKITGEGVPPKTLFSSEEKYVWALTFDDAGNLYAATGTNGKIYKITPTGETSVLFDSQESNIICLLYHQNALYAGSDGKGIIYRIATPDGVVSVVYQTGQKEVHTLVVDAQGNIYAGTVTTATPKPGGPPPSGPPPPGGGPPQEKNSQVYQITADGVVSMIWTAPDPLILGLVVEGKDGLLVGTGDEGKIYRVQPNGDFASLGKCDASQVLAMHRVANSPPPLRSESPQGGPAGGAEGTPLGPPRERGGRLLLATGNPGKIFELKTEHIAEGTLESTTYNAKAISRWGKLSWEEGLPEGTSISFATRTGNTEKPDNTWSDWSEALTMSEESQITSPPAQYIQWRAKLTTSNASVTPVLKKVSVASVQLNIEPQLTSIEIQQGESPKESGGPRGGPPGTGRTESSSEGSKTKRTATWSVEDANNDTLQFTVYYKGIDEVNWKLLKKELSQTNYSWDTTSMADGRYLIKVEATDQLSNPPSWAKSTEKISQPFDIDNTQPTISAITTTANGNGTYQITCTAEDAMSIIQKAVYKIDNDEQWRVIFPDDGIFDSKREVLLLQTETLPPGEHTITIRAIDSAGNQAAGRGNF